MFGSGRCLECGLILLELGEDILLTVAHAAPILETAGATTMSKLGARGFGKRVKIGGGVRKA